MYVTNVTNVFICRASADEQPVYISDSDDDEAEHSAKDPAQNQSPPSTVSLGVKQEMFNMFNVVSSSGASTATTTGNSAVPSKVSYRSLFRCNPMVVSTNTTTSVSSREVSSTISSAINTALHGGASNDGFNANPSNDANANKRKTTSVPLLQDPTGKLFELYLFLFF